MDTTILLALLCTAIESLVVKRNYFISVPMNWYNAQAYCRQHYTDLSFVESQSDQEDICADADCDGVWIGLNRDIENVTGWRWSGRGYVTYTNWEEGQPDNRFEIQTSGALRANGTWFDYYPNRDLPFHCVHLTVLEEEVKKSWEEAVEHCREKHSDLITLSSETKINEAKQLMQELSADRLWVGLRYLADHWLWLSGDPVENQAWSTGADQVHQCPVWNRCGALSKDGLREARDCQEKLNFICG